jgi:hypothetical protein
MKPHVFSGADYQPEIDFKPLIDQFKRIKNLMMDGRARTVDEIISAIKVPGKMDGANAVQAQLRNMRKPKFGGYTIVRNRRGETRESEYRLIT